jgi:2-pyrone-4,6-dicarboxylate lactonase
MSELSFTSAVLPQVLNGKLPSGACDTHNHVFGPFEQFPLNFPPDYAIPLAPVEKYLEMLKLSGLDRGVLVQPSQQDCSMDILLNALNVGGEKLRGVGAARKDITEYQLEKFQSAGIVGLRFVEARAPDGNLRPGSVGFDEIAELTSRMQSLNLSINVWAKMPDLIKSLDKLLAPNLPVVFEHMGMLDVNLGIEDQGFQTMLSLVKEGRLWVKLSVCRCSSLAPEYSDLQPFTEALIEANPDQLLWGSDWPFIRMEGKEPDVSHLISVAKQWVSDPVIENKIFADNPARLYKFEDPIV